MIGKHLLFVYGTLKRGFPRNHALKNARYLGIARTTPSYGMYAYGGFPALVDQVLAEASSVKAENVIYGELYEVDDADLTVIDIIEGTDRGLFERREVKLSDTTLTSLPANDQVWVNLINKTAKTYFFKRNLNGAADNGMLWTQR